MTNNDSLDDGEQRDPPCERCGDPSDHVEPSPTIPWTMLALCDDCHQAWEDGEFEVGATVRRMR